jgi:hypothetical protein
MCDECSLNVRCLQVGTADLFLHPHLEALEAYLGGVQGHRAPPVPVLALPAPLQRGVVPGGVPGGVPRGEPVGVLAATGRFADSARDLPSMWEALLRGRDLITEV